jgi:hypothetical protein
MVGAEFAKKDKTINLIHQASPLSRQTVMPSLLSDKIIFIFSEFITILQE